MFKKLRQFFKKHNNERGSTLTITLAVIAVLSFSAVAVTGLTINLAGQTNTQIASVNDEALAKALITEAINEFEAYLELNTSYDGFIPSIANVVYTDVTSEFPDFGTGTSRVFKFSYLLSSGDNIYKLAYVSTTGSSADTAHPFEFSIATEGDLIMNSGYYDDIKIYGNNIYMAEQAPWEEDDVVYEWVGIYADYRITPAVSSTYPDLSSGQDPSEIFYTESYQYCNGSCYTITEDQSNPHVIKKSVYNDVEGSSLSDQGNISDETISSFFNDFDFEAYVVDQVRNELPTNSRTITDDIGTYSVAALEQLVRDNMDTPNGNRMPNTPYVDVTNYNRYTPWSSNENVNDSYVYDGDLTISYRNRIGNWDEDGMIILGDLTIDNNNSNTDLFLRGTYLVTGNLYIEGEDVDINRATFIVLGQTHIDFVYSGEIKTDGNRYELSILGGDTIFIEGTAEDYLLSEPDVFTCFLYSEESIWIDAVESKLHFEGSLFAKATGNTNYPIPMEDELGNQIHGIVINSYKGYTAASWAGNWWDGFYKTVDYVPGNNDDDNRFNIFPVEANEFQQTFMQIPGYENVTVTEGDYTIFTSEWKKE